MEKQGIQAWLRLAHDCSVDPTATRDDRAEAGLVEDALAEVQRQQELTNGR